MKKIVIGILAHVDAGKTTLSEALLYKSGSIRKYGRVDNGNAFLDTYSLERARGITIFSKQAVIKLEDIQITLLDTPGHVDFSAEMERTLQVLDYAVLVISAADGIQGHTHTLWKLLEKYNIPVFIFVNKMDQAGADKNNIIKSIKTQLSEGCIDFSELSRQSEKFYESIAMCDEEALDMFFNDVKIADTDIRRYISQRKIFPCCFGSALKLEGIDELIENIINYTNEPLHFEEFGAKVFKITRDVSGNRLTHMKITGGTLKVKTVFSKIFDNNSNYKDKSNNEKVNQIRIYSGDKFVVVDEAEAGMICAVTGLETTFPGQGLGTQEKSIMPILQPVLTYEIELLNDFDALQLLPKLRMLEEEEPQLHIAWNDKTQEIQAQVMGEVQIEILKNLIQERFNVNVCFGAGSIVYKETIKNTVEGVGHFEPLRHYAEVHLLLEPGIRGSGMQFATDCCEDMLSKNWQNLVMTHLMEKEHVGVLTGAEITDMKITLISGKAHIKHTEGGDFRQATYRAIRQGLMQAESQLLEPYYDYILEIPEGMVGRAMTDLEKRNATFEIQHLGNGFIRMTGSAPVVDMRDYQKEVIAYTKGYGRLFVTYKGYEACHNSQEVIDNIGYIADSDIDNPTGSVFCKNGSGFNVAWNEVFDYMHIESSLSKESDCSQDYKTMDKHFVAEESIGLDEIDEILRQTYYSNSRDKKDTKKWGASKKRNIFESPITRNYDDNDMYVKKAAHQSKKYLLVDGYNIIFAWEDLKQLALENIDSARGKLIDIMCNYQAIKQYNLILVFDAYRVQGHDTEVVDYHNIKVVYTKEAETADQYIEKFAHENGKKYDVTVATSDGLEQIIIVGQGCKLFSAREFREEVLEAEKKLREDYIENQSNSKIRICDTISEELRQQLDSLE